MTEKIEMKLETYNNLLARIGRLEQEARKDEKAIQQLLDILRGEADRMISELFIIKPEYGDNLDIKINLEKLVEHLGQAFEIEGQKYSLDTLESETESLFRIKYKKEDF